ncbi:hypothetical protein MML48_6g00003767 [Holotrichia oblita]|uniref:Uncharacterized protein n=1 Tax=Holotrichia oblita TaxID=644536 RepID=A0ACB9SXY4_HOLOL|nr:hypothetical protein MML48_6g00003767 [Holotrichia oblita]
MFRSRGKIMVELATKAEHSNDESTEDSYVKFPLPYNLRKHKKEVSNISVSDTELFNEEKQLLATYSVPETDNLSKFKSIQDMTSETIHEPRIYTNLQNLREPTDTEIALDTNNVQHITAASTNEADCTITEPQNDSIITSSSNTISSQSLEIPYIQPEEEPSIEHCSNSRPWTKRSICPYCYQDVTHFPRHLSRHHNSEGAVKELLAMPLKNPKRKVLLDVLRRQGNYLNSNQSNVIRPIRRPRNLSEQNLEGKDLYVTCQDCLGYFKRDYLRRHRKKCALIKKSVLGRQNHLGEGQMLRIYSSNKEFYDSLRLKKEVLSIMRPDIISKTAANDVLICNYGENLLQKHKRPQIKTVVSNKMRELARLLINLKETTGIGSLIDVLVPEFFDNIILATKIISGYDTEAKTFKASSLALHMVCEDPEKKLKNIKRLRHLIESQWNCEISSLALKNLKENQWQKPKLFPLTTDLIKFQEFVMQEAKDACENLKRRLQIKKEFRRLCENVLALTLLLNRKRISEVQYLTVKSYNNTDLSTKQQEEFLKTLSETERALTRNFKRVITGGKHTRPVPILFPKNIQNFIDVLLSLRQECVPETNDYLFPNPATNDKSLSGYHVLKKLATKSGVENQELFTSTRLRKQIATVLQVMNVNEKEMEQFATFMGHTKKTHETYYRLPQEIYQTAKVSKLLMAINKGKGAEYSGKTLDEIEFSDNVESDSESDSTLPAETQEGCRSPITVAGPSGIRHRQNQLCKEVEECSDSESDEAKSRKRKKNRRDRWTEEQKKVLKEFFSTHIKQMKPPRKIEVETLLKDRKKLFEGRNWVNIKAFVYNCYKKK